MTIFFQFSDSEMIQIEAEVNMELLAVTVKQLLSDSSRHILSYGLHFNILYNVAKFLD